MAMGLDTTHDAWHGAYSAFMRWRAMLAEKAGYTATTGNQYAAVDLDWGSIHATIGYNLDGDWPAIPVRHDGTPDPLIVLIAHSDCDGDIQVDMLEPLAARLEELLPLLDGDGGGHIGSYREKTETFIAGLRAAAAAGERLGFE